MHQEDIWDLIGFILGVLFYAGIAGAVVYFWFPGFGSDILDWLDGLLPTGIGIAEVTWRVVGTLAVLVVLTALYFSTGLAGRRRPSGVHGVVGIITGFTVLIFTAAYLYSVGVAFWVALLGGISVSLLLKLLFAYWRTRLAGHTPEQAGTVHVIRRQQFIRRE